MASPLDPNDPRWQLIERILSSPLFEKSPRLRAFLKFICELELTGRRLEINEQQIGVGVFGRVPAYNPGEDSIVRSQARFLRQRLDDYFRSIGQQEPLRVTIPKGTYVPLFEPNPAVANSGLQAEPAFQPRRIRPMVAISTSGLLIVCLIAVVLFLRRNGGSFQTPESRFWNAVFDAHRTHVIVPADSTLILIEELTGKQVSLQSYLSRDYLANMPLPNCLTSLTSSDLAVSHYTSMADLNFVSRIIGVSALQQTRAEIRYARDLSISDAKEDNLVLIGGPRANPWVELFASRMNFYVDYDWKTRQNSVINKAPQKGEAPLYTESAGGAVHQVYGLIAFQPSLDREGNALLAAGTSSAGTQAASDFLTSGRAFGEFLRQIQRPDGGIPHFEVLLEASNLGGNIPQSSIVAYRIVP